MEQVQAWQLQFGIAIVSGTILNFLQRSPRFKWIRPEHFKKLRYVAMTSQLLVALGLHWTFEGDLSSQWAFHLMGPSWSDMLNAGWGYFVMKHTQEHQPPPRPSV